MKRYRLENAQTNLLNMLFVTLTFLLLIACVNTSYSTDITGRVISTDNVPLSNVTALLLPDSLATVTNDSGIFVLKAPVATRFTLRSMGICQDIFSFRYANDIIQLAPTSDVTSCELYTLAGKRIASFANHSDQSSMALRVPATASPLILKANTLSGTGSSHFFIAQTPTVALPIQRTVSLAAQNQSNLSKHGAVNSGKFLRITRYDIVTTEIAVPRDSGTLGDIRVDGRFLVIAPNGKEQYYVGDSMKIIWRVNVRPQSDLFGLFISLDDGRYWEAIPGYECLGPIGNIPWQDTVSAVIPANSSSDECLIRICPFLRVQGCDESDSSFSIHNRQ